MKCKPLPHQWECVDLIDEFGGRALIADEMGLGKTFEALLWAKLNKKARQILVICPAYLRLQWVEEIYDKVGMRCEVLMGTHPPKNKPLPTAPILIIGYEVAQHWVRYLKRVDPALIILDEGHYIKTRTAKRTKAVRKIARPAPYILVLTGTPITSRPAELWSILNLIDPKSYPSFYSFGQEYCDPQWKPWGWEYKGATKLKKLHRILRKKLMIRRLKKDVLHSLPRKQVNVVSLDIIKRREYKKAVDDFLIWLSENEGVQKAKRAMKAEKLVQLGYLKRLAARLKLKSVTDWVDDFLQGTDGKLVLFAIHKKIIKQLKERYKGQCVVVDGSVSMPNRIKAQKRFKRDDKIRIFIGQINAAGVGLNLTAASTVAFAELAWTPGEHKQCEDRIHRIGQKMISSIYYLVARGTIEEMLCKVLQKKARITSETLDGRESVQSLDLIDLLTAKLRKAA